MGLLALTPFARAQIVVEEVKLSDGPAQPSATEFGESVAMSGDTLVVGNPRADVGGQEDAGAVYVYERAGTTWTLQATLHAFHGSAADGFGHSLAIQGDTLVVGAPGWDGATGLVRGRAYVFERSGGVWSQQAALSVPTGAMNDQFGYAVAVDGDTVAVGAPLEGFTSPDYSGVVHVYARTASTWTEQAALSVLTSRLGQSLALDGDVLVAGAPGDSFGNPLNGGTGAAYVFERAGTSWSTGVRLVSTSPLFGHQFGFAVSVSGTTLAISEPWVSVAHVFEKVAGAWTHTAHVRAIVTPASSMLGWSLSFDGDRLLVGAALAASSGVVQAGEAFLFERSGSNWEQRVRLAASDVSQGAMFGSAVAIAGDHFAVGARQHNAAYVFRATPETRSCFGDGMLATPCPCAPPDFVPSPSSAPDAGCANAFDLGGAKLELGGLVQPDTLRFRARIGPSYAAFALLIKGNATSTTGVANGDGVRCADGALIRFGGHRAGEFGDAVGTWSYPNSQQTIAVGGATLQVAGQSAYYQLFYRHAAASFCSPGTTNWSNAVEVVW